MESWGFVSRRLYLWFFVLIGCWGHSHDDTEVYWSDELVLGCMLHPSSRGFLSLFRPVFLCRLLVVLGARCGCCFMLIASCALSLLSLFLWAFVGTLGLSGGLVMLVKSFRLIFPSCLPMWMVANKGYILQV